MPKYSPLRRNGSYRFLVKIKTMVKGVKLSSILDVFQSVDGRLNPNMRMGFRIAAEINYRSRESQSEIAWQ
jgi:hypothetical protein